MQQRYKGYAMAIIGAALWGISGVVAQTLFDRYGYTTACLVPIRMFCSGLLLLMFTQMKTGQRVTTVWKDKTSRLPLLLFAAVGMIGSQFSFFSSIQAGNAATATLLQSLCPLVIMIYLAFKMRQLPSTRDVLALLIAIFGVYLLVTNGSVHRLSISTAAVVWGLINSVFLSFNTLQPKRLFEKWGSAVILGWAMLIGSVLLSLFTHPWTLTGSIIWTPTSMFSLAFVIVFGTLLPFFLFLDSIRFITATEVTLLSNVEPLVAVIVSVTWLNLQLHLYEGIGAVLVIGTVLLLSLPSGKRQKKIQNKQQKKLQKQKEAL